jgi:hypothetical protein
VISGSKKHDRQTPERHRALQEESGNERALPGSNGSCWQIVLQSPKKSCGGISAEGRNKRQSPSNATSNPLAESPVSLAHGGVVAHTIIRSSRLRIGEFEFMPQKDFCNTIGHKGHNVVIQSARPREQGRSPAAQG